MILDWNSFNENKSEDHDAFPLDEINTILNIARDEDLPLDIHYGYTRSFKRLTYAAVINRVDKNGKTFMEEEPFKKICEEIEQRMLSIISGYGSFDHNYGPGAYHPTVTGYKITYWVD